MYPGCVFIEIYDRPSNLIGQSQKLRILIFFLRQFIFWTISDGSRILIIFKQSVVNWYWESLLHKLGNIHMFFNHIFPKVFTSYVVIWIRLWFTYVARCNVSLFTLLLEINRLHGLVRLRGVLVEAGLPFHKPYLLSLRHWVI